MDLWRPTKPRASRELELNLCVPMGRDESPNESEQLAWDWLAGSARE